MENNNYKPRIPDIFEALFDICYLLFDVIAGIIFFAKAYIWVIVMGLQLL